MVKQKVRSVQEVNAAIAGIQREIADLKTAEGRLNDQMAQMLASGQGDDDKLLAEHGTLSARIAARERYLELLGQEKYEAVKRYLVEEHDRRLTAATEADRAAAIARGNKEAALKALAAANQEILATEAAWDARCREVMMIYSAAAACGCSEADIIQLRKELDVQFEDARFGILNSRPQRDAQGEIVE